MINTIVCGIDPNREWLLRVITYDPDAKTSHELMWFFDSRREAEIHFERLSESIPIQNAIVRIVKIRSRI
jgi:hypothetical protein|uniref:Uncharacterized protein n=1 Tax=Siphoviridae sp. ctcK97 TaxID=2825571 RepID=A0A8S5UAX0_9CAUD|nr:MAG TPA: hypothetical protein [Siphoviridae sp. ctcK97]